MELPDDWYVDHDGQSLILDPAKAAGELERLQAAKKGALAVADERGKENVELRTALADLVRHVVAAEEHSPRQRDEHFDDNCPICAALTVAVDVLASEQTSRITSTP